MHQMTRRSFLGTSLAAAAGLGMRHGALAQGASPVAATPTVDPAALKDLRARLHGTLMLPGDSGYESASAPANGRYLDIRPAAVARCADEEDVATCIQWCVENGVAPVPRGGGHSYAGYSTTTGLLIDLRRLNSFVVDRDAGIATVGGAALNNNAMIAFENGPVFIPGGTCLGVGYGGLTLGGGIGYNTHWAGLTSDHLLGSRIVTADGELREIDASSHPDLYWACRGGGGGTFGINTQFTFEVLEAPTDDIAWYRFDWTGADDAAAALAAFDRLIQTAPPALNAVAMAEPTPIGSGGASAAVHTMSRGQYIGPVGELRELIQPLLDAATPEKQVIQPMPYWSVQRMIASAEAESHSWGDISRYAGAPLPDATIAALVEAVVDCPHRTDTANGSIWSLAWVGGDVMNAVPRTETAYVHRDVTTLLRPTTVWSNGSEAEGDDLNAWAEDVIETLKPVTLAESYQNFPNRSIENWEQLYFAENYERAGGREDDVRPGEPVQQPAERPAEVGGSSGLRCPSGRSTVTLRWACLAVGGLGMVGSSDGNRSVTWPRRPATETGDAHSGHCGRCAATGLGQRGQPLRHPPRHWRTISPAYASPVRRPGPTGTGDDSGNRPVVRDDPPGPTRTHSNGGGWRRPRCCVDPMFSLLERLPSVHLNGDLRLPAGEHAARGECALDHLDRARVHRHVVDGPVRAENVLGFGQCDGAAPIDRCRGRVITQVVQSDGAIGLIDHRGPRSRAAAAAVIVARRADTGRGMATTEKREEENDATREHAKGDAGCHGDTP